MSDVEAATAPESQQSEERHARRGPAKTGQSNISDIARLAGVSTATVSRVMRGKGSISEATRAKVMKVVDELGYVPNAHARALTTPPNSVTMVVRAITGGTYSDLMAGVEREVSSRNMTFRLISTGTREGGLQRVVDDLLSQRPKVAVMLADAGTDAEQDEVLNDAFDQLGRVGTKIVLAGRPRLTLNPGIGVVDYANEQGMHDLTAYMVSMGHRCFLFAGKADVSSVFDARYQGFRRALEEAGIAYDPRYDIVRTDDRKTNVEALVSAYAAGARFTAVVASTDAVALDMIYGLRTLGLAVPEQVSVGGFDDMPYAEDLIVPLSTVHVPFAEVGRTAVRMGLGECPDDCVLPTSLAIRRSILPSDGPVLER
ncbi:LacI family DNA-binding transcriptional regulator [Bifidobacterium avesanii]|uniref:LacI family DNA-binding transcriptional regulator n=1 Tax=Bifidobacterium avesanii TaxID=1798157 RepID=A0A7K3TIB9_9BIFI|nr:LacI family DNA-binding transcriptional regulator [Bifidobacterium avesanii]KAB8291045.1 LacI family transcriptional regulator [Bifidobacterium avesanii]NEG78811.1 LacI family DNA-binding transcriptional regulator [Bifidobacterium avesanii]